LSATRHISSLSAPRTKGNCNRQGATKAGIKVREERSRARIHRDREVDPGIRSGLSPGSDRRIRTAERGPAIRAWAVHLRLHRDCSSVVDPVARVGAASSTVAVFLAVIAVEIGGDGWESNPPRTPQQRPADSFEDRGPGIHRRPPACAYVWSPAVSIRGRS
jgi:hypothetical protein